jgi:hypothetical protein
MTLQRTAKTASRSQTRPAPQAESQPHAASHTLLQLQHAIGNQAVQRLVRSGTMQAKLMGGQSGDGLEPEARGTLLQSGRIQATCKISHPGDVYEQEADRVAEHVMLMPDLSQAQSQSVSRHATFPSMQRRSTEREDEVHRQPMEEEEERIQTQEVSGATPEVTPSMESQINSVRGGGQSLSESVRAFFEPRFGQDFSRCACIPTPRRHNRRRPSRCELTQSVGTDRAFALADGCLDP